MINKTLGLAMAVMMSGFLANVSVAHAGTDCGNGNDFQNPGNANPSCGNDNTGSIDSGTASSEAPLPNLGAGPLSVLAIGGGLFFAYRRRAQLA